MRLKLSEEKNNLKNLIKRIELIMDVLDKFIKIYSYINLIKSFKF